MCALSQSSVSGSDAFGLKVSLLFCVWAAKTPTVKHRYMLNRTLLGLVIGSPFERFNRSFVDHTARSNNAHVPVGLVLYNHRSRMLRLEIRLTVLRKVPDLARRPRALPPSVSLGSQHVWVFHEQVDVGDQKPEKRDTGDDAQEDARPRRYPTD